MLFCVVRLPEGSPEGSKETKSLWDSAARMGRLAFVWILGFCAVFFTQGVFAQKKQIGHTSRNPGQNLSKPKHGLAKANAEASQKTNQKALEAAQRNRYLLELLLEYMDRYYVDSISRDKLLEGAVRGMMAASKDPYTRFLNAKEMQRFMSMEDGNRVGIGVELVIEAGIPLIISPMRGGPAERAGIQAKDRIETIGTVPTKGLSIQRLSELITGPKGSPLLLHIRREGFPEPLKIEVIRGDFQLNYVYKRYFPKRRIGYILLSHFFGEESGSIQKFIQSIAELKKQGMRGLVIDLRGNSGGHVDMAVTLAGLFLKKGALVVSSRGRYKPWNRKIFATHPSAGRFSKIPIIVLVNQGSASASEIFSGALQDYNRARLLGERTFGKGSVQRIFRSLPGGAGALITIQKYYTPKGRSIQGKGLEPDIPVASLRPTREENFYYYQMRQNKFLDSFKKKHPKFKNELLGHFLRESQKKGWNFSPPFAIRLLKDYYYDLPKKWGLKTDPQLRRSLEILKNHAN